MSLLLTPLDGRITLKGLLGIGGMGEVHRAWDAGLERPVAVKFVRSGDPKEADRLLLEARLQARVEHPNVVRVHDTGTLEGRPCILLQLVEGQTFAELDTGTDWRVKVGLAAQAARGLGAAHRQGLIHRDVKPANILVEPSPEGPQALLSDFGLARDEEGGLTRSGLMMGTVDFMAPEQVTGVAPVDFRADIYGLGATLYAVLVGRPPFRNTPGSTADAHSTQDLRGATPEAEVHPGDLLRRVMEEEPRSLAAEVPGLPRDLAVVVAKAMEKDPARRYATAEAFADDLERVLRGEPTQARPMNVAERSSRWVRRNPLPARALGVGLLAVLAASGFAAWNGRQRTLATLDAARLGSLAEALGTGLRMNHLAPAHDLTPVLEGIQREIERLRPKARRGGAAAFALGRALEMTSDLDGALEAYLRGWDSGFRTDDLAESLALARVKVFERDVRLSRASLSPEALSRRIAELDRRHAAPAREAMAHLTSAGWRSLWARSILETLNKNFDRARSMATQILEQDPQRYEALVLEARILIWEGDQRLKEGQSKEGLEALLAAQQCGERALQWGRSDPRVYEVLALAHSTRTLYVNFGGEQHAKWVSTALDYLTKAKVISPSDVDILVNHAVVLLAKARNPGKGGGALVPPIIDEAIEEVTRAHRLRPQALLALQKLATAHTAKTQVLYSLGSPIDDALSKAFAAQRELAAAAPEDPLTHWINEVLHYTESVAAFNDDRDAEAPALATVAAARETLKRDPAMAMQANTLFVQALGVLGRATWRNGKDPRPHLQASMEQAEVMVRAAPRNTETLGAAAIAYWIAADQMVDTGGDAEPVLKRGKELCELGLKINPEHHQLLAMKAYLYATESAWRSLRGEDPHPAIQEGKPTLAKAVSLAPGENTIQSSQTLIALAEARWQVDHRQSPERALAASRQAIFRSGKLTQEHRGSLAIGYALQGRWIRLKGGDAKPMGQAGLDALKIGKPEEIRDPSMFILLAVLHDLKGDPKEARIMLDKAVQKNPLAAQGPFFIRTVKELIP